MSLAMVEKTKMRVWHRTVTLGSPFPTLQGTPPPPLPSPLRCGFWSLFCTAVSIHPFLKRETSNTLFRFVCLSWLFFFFNILTRFTAWFAVEINVFYMCILKVLSVVLWLLVLLLRFCWSFICDLLFPIWELVESSLFPILWNVSNGLGHFYFQFIALDSH